VSKKKRTKDIEAPKIAPIVRTEREQEIAKEFIDKVTTDIEITEQAKQMLIGTAIVEEELFKKEIGEYLDSEPVLNPNLFDNNPLMLKYNGNNAKQVMGFCGAYHMDVSGNQLKLWIYDGDRIRAKPLLINSGQFMIKKDNAFTVID
jgi:hypothetical protein